ncbi:MAG: glycosyltransferase [Planctomycetaceae bacterium]
MVFLAYREGLGPIFNSVYVTPAERLLADGFDARVLTMSALGEWIRPAARRRWKAVLDAASARLPGRMHRLPCPPNRAQWAWQEGEILRRWMTWTFGRDRRVILHCGGSRAAAYALDARQHLPKLRVVYQCWGPEAAEHIYDNTVRGANENVAPVRAEASRRDRLQSRAFVESDAVISISRSMSNWGIEEYGALESRILEVPCFVDTARFRPDEQLRASVRRELGAQDRFVVVYVGSMFRWQFPDGCFEIFRSVQKRYPNALFLAITTSPDAMRRRVHEQGIPESASHIVSVPFEEVPRYVLAGDLAILGRGIGEEPTLVNGLSSPVKFGEYLASGLPVVLSEGIGDFSSLAQEMNLGVVLPYKATPAIIRQLVLEFLEKQERNSLGLQQCCRDVAVENLALSAHIPRLAKLYRELART